MKRLFLFVLLPLTAFAQNGEWNQTAFGERGVYELESQFSYISAWGVTDLHDRVTTTNGGTVSLNNGFLEVQSGTTNNATADLETVERVIYESGRQIEASIKIGVQDAPTNGATAEWGLGTDDNGAYFRLTDGTFSVVYEDSGTEVETTRENFRADNAACVDFDPTEDPGIYIVRFSWYGAAGASYWVYYPRDDEPTTLRECLLHYEAPDNDGDVWNNPNLPIFASVDSGSNGDDVVLTVGGRRAGTQGKMTQNFRSTGDFRFSQAVAAADDLVPLICARRESDFPTASDLNAIPLSLIGFGLVTNNDALVYFVTDPDLTGASFGTPTFAVDGETALEMDKSATALSNPKHVSAPYLVSGGQGNQMGGSRISPNLTVPFIGEDPTCLAANVDTDSTITSTLRINEGW